MSRRKFRSGKNKRQERCLSAVCGKKINADKPVWGLVPEKIIIVVAP
jgi:hypothetical protein